MGLTNYIKSKFKNRLENLWVNLMSRDQFFDQPVLLAFSVVRQEDELPPHGPHHLPKLGCHRFQGLVQLLRSSGDPVPGPDGAHATRQGYHGDRLCQLQVPGVHPAKPDLQE